MNTKYKDLAFENRPKSALLAVKIPEDDLAEIEKKAASFDLKKATYVRLALREKPVRVIPADEYLAERNRLMKTEEEILQELRRIGEVNPNLSFGVGSAESLDQKLTEIKEKLLAVSVQQLALLTPADDE